MFVFTVILIFVFFGIPVIIAILKKKPEETLLNLEKDPYLREQQYQGCIFVLVITLLIFLYAISLK